MNVLIQDGQSKKYFTPAREWNSDVRVAKDFESHRLAYEVASQTGATSFNIILYSPVGRYAFSIDHGKGN